MDIVEVLRTHRLQCSPLTAPLFQGLGRGEEPDTRGIRSQLDALEEALERAQEALDRGREELARLRPGASPARLRNRAVAMDHALMEAGYALEEVSARVEPVSVRHLPGVLRGMFPEHAAAGEAAYPECAPSPAAPPEPPPEARSRRWSVWNSWLTADQVIAGFLILAYFLGVQIVRLGG